MPIEIRRALVIGCSIVIASAVVSLAVMLKPQAGRYQMSGAPGHAYVIDTVTGEVWEDFAIPTQGSSDPNFKKPKPR